MASRRGGLLGLVALSALVAGLLLLAWTWVAGETPVDAAREASRVSAVAAPEAASDDALSPPLPAIPEAEPLLEPLDVPASLLGLTASGSGAPGGTGALSITLTWDGDEAPAADIGLSVCSLADPEWFYDARQGRSDATGRCVFEALQAGPFALSVDRMGEVIHGGAKWTIVAGQTFKMSLRVPRGPTVRGLVLTPTGDPAPGASIWITDDLDAAGSIVATSDAGGRFEIANVRAQRELSACKPGFSASPRQLIDGRSQSDGDIGLDPNRVIEVQLVLGLPGGSIRGVVVNLAGEPVPSAVILVGGGEVWLPPPDSGEDVRASPPLAARTDAQGRFDFTDVREGPAPLAARAAGLGPTVDEIVVIAGQTTSARVVLAPPAEIVGIVRDARGEPFADVKVSTGGHELLTFATSTSDAEGRYRLSGIPAGEVNVWAYHQSVKQKTRAVLPIVVGASHTWDPVIDTGLELRGRVVRPSGAPVQSVRVKAEAAAMGKSVTDFSDADGRFRLLECMPGPLTVAFRDTRANTHMDNLVLTDVLAGGDELVVTLPEATAATAHVLVRVVDSEGQPTNRFPVGLALGSRLDWLDDKADPGVFRGGPFPPGEYQLVVELHGPFHRDSVGVVLRAGETTDAGVLTLPAPARIVARVRAVDPAVLQGCKPLVTVPGSMDTLELQWDAASVSPTGATAQSELAPGRYLVEVVSKVAARAVREVTLEAGETVELDFDLVRGVKCKVLVELPARPGHAPDLQLVVHPSGGAPVTSRLYASRSQDPATWKAEHTQLMAAGAHRVQLLLDRVLVREDLLVAPLEGEGVLSIKID